MVIHAGRLLADPDSGKVTTDQSIVVEGDRIKRIEPGYLALAGARIIDLRDSLVMPGLIDGHVHITKQAGPSARIDEVIKTPADLALDAATFARVTLQAGFTTVVDLGIIDHAANNEQAVFALRSAIASGKLPGPRILAAGSMITPHGGHGDVHGFRPDVMAVLANPSTCSGADDCRRAVRDQVKRGADIIKVTATGGVLSDTSAGLGQQFTSEELTAIVETAHVLNRPVTAHAHGANGINAALNAGVDSIQHGTFLDADSLVLFRKSHAVLLPTLIAEVTIGCQAQDPNWMTAPIRAKALTVAPAAIAAAGRAYRAGVRFAFGTDAGVFPHGGNADEFTLLTQAGLSPLEAIRSATTDAARLLKLEAELGSIAPEKVADIIAVKRDPLKDVAALENVSFVMRAGRTIDLSDAPPVARPCME